MNNKTYILELTLKEKGGKTIHTIGLPDFKLEEIDLCFFDDMLKESKENLFDILRKAYYND
jgi:hypothetical protein